MDPSLARIIYVDSVSGPPSSPDLPPPLHGLIRRCPARPRYPRLNWRGSERASHASSSASSCPRCKCFPRSFRRCARSHRFQSLRHYRPPGIHLLPRKRERTDRSQVVGECSAILSISSLVRQVDLDHHHLGRTRLVSRSRFLRMIVYQDVQAVSSTRLQQCLLPSAHGSFSSKTLVIKQLCPWSRILRTSFQSRTHAYIS